MVINRGNYRSWIFEGSGARKSFLSCLDEACVSMGWRLYAWCLMDKQRPQAIKRSRKRGLTFLLPDSFTTPCTLGFLPRKVNAL